MPKIPMLFRFSLYGFLKNQQYYDPFIILAFREKGLSFFMIGLLMGFRDICINVMEIPSGAVADLYGRRLAMILSFTAYIGAFLIFGGCTAVWMLFPAMLFFAIGEAFRTGTHKAMIFTWLRNRDRLDERTRIYGYTRSWSKMGSAVSVVVATGLVFYTGRYSAIFYWCIVPYVLNIINFMGYPKEVDIDAGKKVSAKAVGGHLWDSFKQVFAKADLRRLLIEDVGFEGTYKSVKDYLQPVLKSAAVALPVLVFMDTPKRAAILVGVVYFILYVMSSIASRRAHSLVDRSGGEEQAARVLWRVNLAAFAILTPLLFCGFHLAAAGVFIVMAILQNFWRPLIITRIDHHSKEESGATVLSIESQSRTFFNMLAAPVLGLVVDMFGFGPVGALGLVITILIMATGKDSMNNNSEHLNNRTSEHSNGH